MDCGGVWCNGFPDFGFQVCRDWRAEKSWVCTSEVLSLDRVGVLRMILGLYNIKISGFSGFGRVGLRGVGVFGYQGGMFSLFRLFLGFLEGLCIGGHYGIIGVIQLCGSRTWELEFGSWGFAAVGFSDSA